MNYTAEDYLAKAKESEERAAEAGDSSIRRQWLDAAKHCREMAQAAEKCRW